MSKTGLLVDKHFKRRLLDAQLLERCRKDEAEQRPCKPVITISRELGTGGRSVGRLVADMLHFEFYDKEILNRIATEANSSPDHIEHVESTGRDGFTALWMNMLDKRHVTDTVYLRSLLKIIRRLGDEGRAVIIGRGGACVLPHALKVRMIAPLELRAERMAVLDGVSVAEAAQRVLEYDHIQARFLRSYFGCDINDTRLYDLIINTEAMALEHAAELIVTRARQLWPLEEA